MDLHIVLLNWNASEDTIGCVNQLLQWREVKPHIWIVDNASDEADRDAISAAFDSHPAVSLIHNKQNQGFSGGSNIGIRAALEMSGEVVPVLLLNNDAALSEETAKQLLKTLESDPSLGVVGPLLFADADHSQLVSAGSRNPVTNIHNQILVPSTGRLSPVGYISGSVALFRPELFQHAGLFDERYFFSGEVADLCRRARQHGLQCVVDGAAQAHHNLDRSAPQRGTLHTYYIVRNRFLYIRKFYRLMRFPLLAFWAIYGLLLGWKLNRSGNRATSAAVRLATGDGISGRFGGQNKRVLAAAEAATSTDTKAAAP